MILSRRFLALIALAIAAIFLVGATMKVDYFMPLNSTANRIALIDGGGIITNWVNGTGALTNNGSGGLGWYDISSLGGGSGIGSVYTNNVLAGGPGLTELGFTNTATVTVAATTNAGRVTMSFESATGSGIATNAGTGWFTTLYGLTNGPINTNSIALTMNLPVNQTTNGLLINAPTNYPHTPLEIRWAESASGGQKKVSFSGGTSGSAQIMTLLMQDKSGFGNRINVNGANVGNEVQFQTSGANGIGSFGTTGFGISGSVLKLGGNSGLSVSAFNGNAHLAAPSAGILIVSNGTAGGNLRLDINGDAYVRGALFLSRFATNANVTMTTNFHTWAVTSVAVLVTNTLPTAAQCKDIHYLIQDEGGNAAATNIVIVPVAGDRINGATSAIISANYGSKKIYSSGSTNWFTY